MYLPDHSGSIGVFDSGIGGLSVANAISGLLPRETMLYVADNHHAPYGARTEAEVYDYSRAITDFLLAAGCKLIVIACNTATSIAIDRLREAYPSVPFVGLEPALKPAAGRGRVGVMATAVTLRSRRYRALKARYLTAPPVWENACEGLVPLIENHPPGSPYITTYLRDRLGGAPEVDVLVLGCTHYPLVYDDILAQVGPEMTIIDPSIPAARQVQRLLTRHELLNDDDRSPTATCDFLCTRGPAPLQRALLRLPDLNGRRRWLLGGVDTFQFL